jgi:hypothetical protein
MFFIKRKKKRGKNEKDIKKRGLCDLVYRVDSDDVSYLYLKYSLSTLSSSFSSLAIS